MFKRLYNIDIDLDKIRYIIIDNNLGITNHIISYLEVKYNLKRSLIDDVEKLNKLGTLFTSNNLYVCINDKVGEELFSINNNVIQIGSSIDKRTKLYKSNKDKILEIPKLKEDNIIKFIISETGLNLQQATDICTICDNNISDIIYEIYKYNNFKGDYIDFRQCVYKKPKDVIFEFINAFIGKSPNTNKLLIELLHYGVSTFALFPILNNQIKLILQLKTCKEEYNIGVNPYIISKIKPLVNKRTEEELVKMIRIISRLDIKVKENVIKEDLAIKYLVVYFA